MEVLLKKLNIINKAVFRMAIEFMGYNKKKCHIKILDYFFLACFLKKRKGKLDFLEESTVATELEQGQCPDTIDQMADD